jgi:hypothetical protein
VGIGDGEERLDGAALTGAAVVQVCAWLCIAITISPTNASGPNRTPAASVTAVAFNPPVIAAPPDPRAASSDGRLYPRVPYRWLACVHAWS